MSTLLTIVHADIKTVQEKMYSEPKYDSSKRTRRKYTQEVEEALQEVLKQKEVYVRQHYDFGDRLEYDFGEVLLDCGKGIRKHYMAVISSPASNFRWAYLYTNQKQAVFQDSHVKFFEMMGGVWKEVVYDNMKNVVSKFIGKMKKN